MIQQIIHWRNFCQLHSGQIPASDKFESPVMSTELGLHGLILQIKDFEFELDELQDQVPYNSCLISSQWGLDQGPNHSYFVENN